MASRRRPAIIAIFTVLFSSLLISQKTTQIHPGRGGSPHVRSEPEALSVRCGHPVSGLFHGMLRQAWHIFGRVPPVWSSRGASERAQYDLRIRFVFS